MSDLGVRRLISHGLEGPGFTDPAAVVQAMGAMQAQDYSQALWAIAVRTAGATAADVEQALASRTIVRTWPLRGTLHVVAADDVRWMLALSRDRMVGRDAGRLRQLGLDAADVTRARELFAEALGGGKRLSRAEMLAVLARAGLDPAGQRGHHLLWHAAQHGDICLGPMAGREPTFVRLDDWVGPTPALGKDEALATLARRYAASHGPATAQDFAWWAALTLTDARRALDAAAIAPATSRKPARPSAHLLPGFDEYLLGYADRSDVLPAAHAGKIAPGGNGIFLPTIVVDGQVVGTWKRAVRKRALVLTLLPFRRVTGLRARLEAAAARHARFLGVPLAAVTVSAPAPARPRR